ncbi:hypothetical protein BVRB_8g190030 [Beta vulgaris subsp. vulgaris]|nr:hypothetical protein BVRB_8g190030 [Beta vulgaris subsp. vulgaris]
MVRQIRNSSSASVSLSSLQKPNLRRTPPVVCEEEQRISQIWFLAI